ncbi:MAG: FAD-dependent oxidoreductase [Aeromicrobium erythreum]
MSDPMSHVVVVGAGLAGFHTAAALRRLGHQGDITVLGAEEHAPYDRPPLSKAFLSGSIGAADLALDDPDAPLDVAWERGVGVVGLEPGAAGAPHRVLLADGTDRRADHVVVATGADAVRLGDHVPGAHVLRTLEDAERLRGERIEGARVVVVGDGFVALEAASTVVALGAASVVVAGPEERPLERRYGPELAASLLALHAPTRRRVPREGSRRRRHLRSRRSRRRRAAGRRHAPRGRRRGRRHRRPAGDQLARRVRPSCATATGPRRLRRPRARRRSRASGPSVTAPAGTTRCAGRCAAPGTGQDALDHAAAVAAALTGAAAPAAHRALLLVRAARRHAPGRRAPRGR